MKKVNIDFKKLLTQKKIVFPILIAFMGSIIVYAIFGKGGIVNMDEQEDVVVTEGVNANISDVSSSVKSNNIQTKKDAVDSYYTIKNTETEMNSITPEQEQKVIIEGAYTEEELAKQRKELENSLNNLKEQTDALGNSNDSSLSSGYSAYKDNSEQSSAQSSVNEEKVDITKIPKDQLTFEQREQVAYLKALESQFEPKEEQEITKEPDPIELMKRQYEIMDSIEMSKDPRFQEIQKQRKLMQQYAEFEELNRIGRYKVTKYNSDNFFNTIRSEEYTEFIKAIVDEDKNASAGSRITIKIKEPLKVGKYTLEKNTFIYAMVTGFSPERVYLKVNSIMYKNQILPISLIVYDIDGMEGLYVPRSSFKDITSQMLAEGIQGQSIDSEDSNFITKMGTKAFTTMTQIFSGLLRKESAKIKFETKIFLIDEASLSDLKNNIK